MAGWRERRAVVRTAIASASGAMWCCRWLNDADE